MVKSNKEYSLMSIVREGLIPGVRDHQTIRKIIRLDTEGENILKTRIDGDGRMTTYRIAGQNLQRFIEKYGPGLELLQHKKQQTHGGGNTHSHAKRKRSK